MAVRSKKTTSENIRKVIKSIGILTNEDTRFEQLTATKEMLSLVYGNEDVYAQALNMLTGINHVILKAGREKVSKRYKIVLQHLCDMNISQFAVTANLFPPLEYYLLLKERCDSCNDNAACNVLNERINGDPDAEDEISNLGLLGLWNVQDNREVGSILVALQVITQDEFERTIDERNALTKPTETVHGCSVCGGIFPESKCVKAKLDGHEEWVCITDFERLEAEGKAILVKRFEPEPKAELTPTPGIPVGFEIVINDMKARGEEWGNVMVYIDKTYGYDEKLISKATEIYYKPTSEPTVVREVESPVSPQPELEGMKHAIEERMKKLKTKESVPKPESLVVKEEIEIPPSNTTLMYMSPSDYEKWGYGDFEGTIHGLGFEDLQQLSNHVGLSKKMTEQEKDDIRVAITNRMNEIRVG